MADTIDSSVAVLAQAKVCNPSTGRLEGALQGLGIRTVAAAASSTTSPWNKFFASPKDDDKNKVLVVILPQLGDFDTWDYCEQMAASLPALQQNRIQLRVIGNPAWARRFARMAKAFHWNACASMHWQVCIEYYSYTEDLIGTFLHGFHNSSWRGSRIMS